MFHVNFESKRYKNDQHLKTKYDLIQTLNLYVLKLFS